MDRPAMEGISSRLATVEGLYFPGAIHGGAPDLPHRRAALLDLLSRDAPLFLERYGSELTPDELASFEALGSDYEVGWHLDRIWRGRQPTAASAVRNRRRAYMERLVHAGEYFSEDAMREREPYLHHEYLGKFQDAAGRGMARPGERWSETLMRRWEEATLVEKIRGEQKRMGVPEEEWVGGEEDGGEEEEEEVEEEMEEVSEEEENGSSAAKENGELESNGSAAECSAAGVHKPLLSAEEMDEQLEQFTHLMQQKFLSGEDSEYLDYSKIDNDERLDDHWHQEANHDAEEKYFDED